MTVTFHQPSVRECTAYVRLTGRTAYLEFPACRRENKPMPELLSPRQRKPCVTSSGERAGRERARDDSNSTGRSGSHVVRDIWTVWTDKSTVGFSWARGSKTTGLPRVRKLTFWAGKTRAKEKAIQGGRSGACIYICEHIHLSTVSGQLANALARTFPPHLSSLPHWLPLRSTQVNAGPFVPLLLACSPASHSRRVFLAEPRPASQLASY